MVVVIAFIVTGGGGGRGVTVVVVVGIVGHASWPRVPELQVGSALSVHVHPLLASMHLLP